jgi:hypothetical protein
VLVSGEPGIGKSRITAALGERVDAEPHIRLCYFWPPYHQDSALFPFIDQLGRSSGLVRDDPPVARLEKLEDLLVRAAPPVEDVAFVADLLSLPASERYPLPDLFEDAHCIDPTSRKLLDLAVERVPRRCPTTSSLKSPTHRRRAVFVEELTKSVLESGLLRAETDRYMLHGPVPPFAIPTSLHDPLRARLDRLAYRPFSTAAEEETRPPGHARVCGFPEILATEGPVSITPCDTGQCHCVWSRDLGSHQC